MGPASLRIKLVQIYSHHRISMMDFVAEEASACHPSEKPHFFCSENIFKNPMLIFASFNHGFIAEASNM